MVWGSPIDFGTNPLSLFVSYPVAVLHRIWWLRSNSLFPGSPAHRRADLAPYGSTPRYWDLPKSLPCHPAGWQQRSISRHLLKLESLETAGSMSSPSLSPWVGGKGRLFLVMQVPTSKLRNKIKQDQANRRFRVTSWSWSWTQLLSPPASEVPQVTTDPSDFNAAKANDAAWMCSTFFSWSCTSLLSPPSRVNMRLEWAG